MSASGGLRRPSFIAFEGGEGSGKSTQARILAEAIDAVVTREPGGTAIGQRIREVVLGGEDADLDQRAEALLMAADRAQHVAEVIRPALAQGRNVVTDRFIGSSLAYQGHGRGLPVAEVAQLSAWATEDLQPDLVVLLDLPLAESQGRLGRSLDRVERAGAEFHGRVIAGYRALAAADPGRWEVVDGSGPVDVVAEAVATVVAERLGVGGRVASGRDRHRRGRPVGRGRRPAGGRGPAPGGGARAPVHAFLLVGPGGAASGPPHGPSPAISWPPAPRVRTRPATTGWRLRSSTRTCSWWSGRAPAST